MMTTGPTRSRPILLVAALIGLGVAWPAVAQQGQPRPDGPQWSLGVGVISSPRPYVGADNETRVIPLLEVEWGRFYFQGIQAGYRLVDRDGMRLDLRARGRFGGFDEGDSEYLRGMEERRETVDAGVGLEWDVGRFELGLGVYADALGRSDGVEASAQLTWPKILRRGRVGFFPSVGVVWQSGGLVDYYAGVRPDEAEPWRPAYEGEAALNVEAGVLAFYRFTDKVRGIALVRAQRLAGEYQDSPIIDDRWGYFGLVGAAYSF